jgi:hypothetical protein
MKILKLGRTSFFLGSLVLSATVFSGCSKGGAGSSEAALVTAAPGPAGYTWDRTDIASVGSYEVPTGGKWQKEGMGAANEELDVTLMVQVQGGIEPEDRAAYIKSLVDVNKRDAPKFEVVSEQNGQVNQVVAGRVDGKFDNGTAYATRDYVLFRNHMALAIMVRGPITKQADVQSISDHVVASLK